jgi:hypothetical protein
MGESVRGEVDVTDHANEYALAVHDRNASDVRGSERVIGFREGRIDTDDDRVDGHHVRDQRRLLLHIQLLRVRGHHPG